MRVSQFVSLLALALPSLAAASTKEEAIPETQGFIIELAGGTRGQNPGKIFTDLTKRSFKFLVLNEFTNPDFFFGLAIIADDETIASLSNIDGVKKVWHNPIIQSPLPVSNVTVSDKKLKKGSKAVSLPHVTGDSNINSPLNMTGVDRLHALGVTGKGVKVAVIDSGVDYRHPALGGGFGPGFKVVGGYDLVGDAYDIPTNSPAVPDEDPGVECDNGHGTHIAGIIAGKDLEGEGFGFVGVAPDAQILAYRINGCNSLTSAWSFTMEAMQRAIDDGADIVNLSLGGREHFTVSWEVFARAEKLGIAVIAAAGNNGPDGPFYTNFPAVNRASISVGSVQNEVLPIVYHAGDPNNETVSYVRVTPIDPTLGKINAFYATNTEDGSDCDESLWEDAAATFPDLSKVAVLVDPDSICSWNAFERAATYGIGFVMTRRGSINQITFDITSQVPESRVDLPSSSYFQVRAGIQQYGEDYTLDVTDPSVHDAKQVEGGTMMRNSAFGPTADFKINPHISAPGQNIFSLWPIRTGVGYSIDSGTSMSCPHIAGVFALLKGEFPDLGPREILSLVQSTATPVRKFGIDGALTTVAQQGAGLVNAYAAYRAQVQTLFSQGYLEVRDGETSAPQSITVTNKSNKEKKYTLGHKGALLIKATPKVDNEDLYFNELFTWEENNSKDYGVPSFSANEFSLAAGESKAVTIILDAPDVDSKYVPIYSGFITLEDGTLDYSLPYIGAPYNLTEASTLDFSDSVRNSFQYVDPVAVEPPVPYQPFLMDDRTNKRNTGFMNKTMDGTQPLDVVYTIRQPSPYVRLDLVSSDVNITVDKYGFDPSVTYETEPPTYEPLDNFLNVPSYGEIMSASGSNVEDPPPISPVQGDIGNQYSLFGSVIYQWYSAKVADGNGTVKRVPDADYRVLVRALKPGREWRDESGYESWLSPVVRIINEE